MRYFQKIGITLKYGFVVDNCNFVNIYNYEVSLFNRWKFGVAPRADLVKYRKFPQTIWTYFI